MMEAFIAYVRDLQKRQPKDRYLRAHRHYWVEWLCEVLFPVGTSAHIQRAIAHSIDSGHTLDLGEIEGGKP